MTIDPENCRFSSKITQVTSFTRELLHYEHILNPRNFVAPASHGALQVLREVEENIGYWSPMY